MTHATVSGSAIALLTNAGISEENLLAAYGDLRGVSSPSRTDLQLLAEVSFLLGRHYKREGDLEKAKAFGAESIALYADLRISTLEDAAPILWRHLPDIMSEGIVARELS